MGKTAVHTADPEEAVEAPPGRPKSRARRNAEPEPGRKRPRELLEKCRAELESERKLSGELRERCELAESEVNNLRELLEGYEVELESERKRIRELLEKCESVMGDYANLERRTASDILNGINQKTDPLLRDFLDIYDDFVRARDAYSSGGADTAGLDSIIRNLEAMFKRNDVEAIGSTGLPFDPQLHEAMLTREEPDMEEHTVVRELRKGYITQGRVLRPALVEISTKGGAE